MSNEWEKEFKQIYHAPLFGLGLADSVLSKQNSLISFITSLLASEQAHWLRSEIERLEARQEEIKENHRGSYKIIVLTKEGEGAIDELTSIITRYKEELLELEKGV